jgi:acyl-CoA synthetase (AMP-forming)/AMP-acid ligase II
MVDNSSGWGMTETSPYGTLMLAQPGAKRKVGSCGMPMPGIVIKFLNVDDPSKYVPLSERGEICIQGPNVMKGYWHYGDSAFNLHRSFMHCHRNTKADKMAGVTRADMKAYEDLNKSLTDPFPLNMVRTDRGHSRGAPHSQAPHGHVGPVDHIPIVDP